MIGSRLGSITQPLLGSAVGSISDDEGLSDPFAGITVDSGLDWRLPNNSVEWAILKSATAGSWAMPNHLWLLQEPSGNPADTIGTGVGIRNLTATTAAAAPLYQQTVSGVTRKFIVGNGALNNCNLRNTTMVNTVTDSYAWLGVVRSDQATVLRNVVIYGSPTFSQPASKKFRLRLNASIQNTVDDHTDTVQLIFVVYNRAISTIKMYTPLEKLEVAFSASVGSTLTHQLSATGDNTVAYFAYSTAWDQTSAEFTDAQAKNLMEGILKYSVPWS